MQAPFRRCVTWPEPTPHRRSSESGPVIPAFEVDHDGLVGRPGRSVGTGKEPAQSVGPSIDVPIVLTVGDPNLDVVGGGVGEALDVRLVLLVPDDGLGVDGGRRCARSVGLPRDQRHPTDVSDPWQDSLEQPVHVALVGVPRDEQVLDGVRRPCHAFIWLIVSKSVSERPL